MKDEKWIKKQAGKESEVMDNKHEEGPKIIRLSSGGYVWR